MKKTCGSGTSASCASDSRRTPGPDDSFELDRFVPPKKARLIEESDERTRLVVQTFHARVQWPRDGMVIDHFVGQHVDRRGHWIVSLRPRNMGQVVG